MRYRTKQTQSSQDEILIVAVRRLHIKWKSSMTTMISRESPISIEGHRGTTNKRVPPLAWKIYRLYYTTYWHRKKRLADSQARTVTYGRCAGQVGYLTFARMKFWRIRSELSLPLALFTPFCCSGSFLLLIVIVHSTDRCCWTTDVQLEFVLYLTSSWLFSEYIS